MTMYNSSTSNGSIRNNNNGTTTATATTTTYLDASSSPSSNLPQQNHNHHRLTSRDSAMTNSIASNNSTGTTTSQPVYIDWTTHFLAASEADRIHVDLSNHKALKKLDRMDALVQALMDYCPDMVTLDLSNNHLGTKGIKPLRQLLASPSHSSLQYLHLGRNALKGGRALRPLVTACASNPNLRLLDVSHNQLCDKSVCTDLATLLDSREVECRLTELDVRNNGPSFTEKSAWALGGALVQGNNTTLTVLKLSGNALGPSGGDALGTLLKLSHTLQALYVSNCNLGDEGVGYICQGLLMAESEPVLRILDVGWNVLHDEAAYALANVLEATSTLQQIQLECNGIGDKGAVALATALPLCASLISLDVTGNQIHDGGAIALAVALTDRRCHSIQLHWKMNAHMTPVGSRRIEGALRLRNSRNQWLDELLSSLQDSSRYPSLNYTVMDDEVVEICRHVAHQQRKLPVTLPVVRFRGHGITVRGATAIANHLLCPPSVTLIRLYLCHTQIGDDGADIITQALLRNRTLTALTCTDCRLTSVAAIHLSRVLSRHGALTRLDLRNNNIGSEGARSLLHAITEEAHHIHTLYLGNNQIGDSAVRSLTSVGRLVLLQLGNNELTDAASLDLARICGNIAFANAAPPFTGTGTVVAPIESQHEIRWLYVEGNFLTQRGIDALNIFLPRVCTMDTSAQRWVLR